jgi:glycosyltransferase involved in cell wall biosynthesis
MISVLTLTYKRPHLLEEAIKSFLSQENANCPIEMVVINDNPEVDYIYDDSNDNHIRIINHKERFPSIASKLQWGFTQCKYDTIYRLDDDDLLAPWALQNLHEDMINHPGFDVYRSYGMYLFSENKYEGIHSNVNNGNVYTKAYLERIKFPDTSIGEDADITFHKGGTIYESKLLPTMIYRWGMNTLHISGMGNVSNQQVLDQADRVLDNRKGIIELHPKFLNDYYGAINKT